MAKIVGKLYFKLNFFCRKRQCQHVPIQDEDVEDIEDFRTRGSDILKEIAKASESTTARSPSIRKTYRKDDSTYSSGSGKSETDIQETRQEASKSQQQKEGKRMDDFKEKRVSSGNEWQSKVKRLKYLKRTIELARRKRFDTQGSFAVNMVTYRDHNNKIGSNINEKGNGEKDNRNHSSTYSSIRRSGQDDQSRSSESTCVTNDVTLQVIDEEIAYYNTSGATH